jgi:hypothetical protein
MKKAAIEQAADAPISDWNNMSAYWMLLAWLALS